MKSLGAGGTDGLSMARVCRCVAVINFPNAVGKSRVISWQPNVDSRKSTYSGVSVQPDLQLL